MMIGQIWFQETIPKRFGRRLYDACKQRLIYPVGFFRMTKWGADAYVIKKTDNGNMVKMGFADKV